MAADANEQRIGDFEEPSLREPLTVTLYPEEGKLRWSHCSATAELVARFFAALPETAPLEGSISYVTNELVENAIKFHVGGAIRIEAGLCEEGWSLLVENSIPEARREALSASLTELATEDPNELFIRRVEENAENPERGGSGLGFLTMINDYQVRFGWRLQARGGKLYLATLARLPLG